jgi:hypothetical protein
MPKGHSATHYGVVNEASVGTIEDVCYSVTQQTAYGSIFYYCQTFVGGAKVCGGDSGGITRYSRIFFGITVSGEYPQEPNYSGPHTTYTGQPCWNNLTYSKAHLLPSRLGVGPVYGLPN